ncbi:hypothetical protein ACEPAH_138 [Sanghuangporus vaninii]
MVHYDSRRDWQYLFPSPSTFLSKLKELVNAEELNVTSLEERLVSMRLDTPRRPDIFYRSIVHVADVKTWQVTDLTLPGNKLYWEQDITSINAVVQQWFEQLHKPRKIDPSMKVPLPQSPQCTLKLTNRQELQFSCSDAYKTTWVASSLFV